MSSRVDNNNPRCCENGKIISNNLYCFPIIIPSDDPIHKQTDEKCMNFARTQTDRDNEVGENKSNRPAEQINVVTAFLDLSLIYGNSEKQAHAIRSHNGGRFLMDGRDGKEWPLHNPEADKHCFLDAPDDVCYTGGDDRLNQSPHLAILHIFYIREHNRLADILQSINSHWNDEKIFQEARRINIAQFQYVTYYEWLPLILGEENLKNAKMIYYESGDEYVNDYNSTIDPSVFNSHASSAFRYYHSEIEGTLQ
jgi:peroxidase